MTNRLSTDFDKVALAVVCSATSVTLGSPVIFFYLNVNRHLIGIEPSDCNNADPALPDRGVRNCTRMKPAGIGRQRYLAGEKISLTLKKMKSGTTFR